MRLTRSGTGVFAVLIIGAIFLIPALGAWLLWGHVPALSALEARARLDRPQSRSLLIDVRTPEAFATRRVNGAHNWPWHDIEALESLDSIPEDFAGCDLLFICWSGFQSAYAAERVNRLFGVETFNVKGGLQEWVKGTAGCDSPFCRMASDAGLARAFPIKTASVFEQLAACAAAFAIKPLYMLMAFWLIIRLWPSREDDLTQLRRALIFFLAGEGFCALNYLVFNEASYLVEYLHICGMVLAFGFTVYAWLRALDHRLLYVSDPEKRCRILGLCKTCYKYEPAVCGFYRLLALFAGVFLIIAGMPLLADIHTESYNTWIFGAYYNYTHPAIFQYFELRYAPEMAALFFALVLILYMSRPKKGLPVAVAAFSAGSGLLGFSLFRMIIFQIYRDDLLWYIVWEEITELLYVTVILVMLYMFSRSRTLLPRSSVICS